MKTNLEYLEEYFVDLSKAYRLINDRGLFNTDELGNVDYKIDKVLEQLNLVMEEIDEMYKELYTKMEEE